MFSSVEFPFHKWEQVLSNGRFHLTKACNSKRMEPTVGVGKHRFHNYWGMGKSLSPASIIGLCLLAHGSGAFGYLAASLKYIFRDKPVMVIVRNYVTPEARIGFDKLFDDLTKIFEQLGLRPPVAFSEDLIADWGLDIFDDTCEDVDAWIHKTLALLRNEALP